MLNELFRGMDDDERAMWRSIVLFFGVVLGVVAGFFLVAAGVVWLFKTIAGSE